MKKILLRGRGQFRRRQDGFNFHFASREGREGGEGNLQSIYTLGCCFFKLCQLNVPMMP
jgi:hypothetical protein